MSHSEFKAFNIEQLMMQKRGLEDRISRIQKDLKCPLEPDLEDQAIDLAQRNILSGILRSENEYLSRIEAEIAMRN
jgi:hypothetical protein